MGIINRGGAASAIWRLLDGCIKLGCHSSSSGESILVGGGAACRHLHSSCSSGHADDSLPRHDVGPAGRRVHRREGGSISHEPNREDGWSKDEGWLQMGDHATGQQLHHREDSLDQSSAEFLRRHHVPTSRTTTDIGSPTMARGKEISHPAGNTSGQGGAGRLSWSHDYPRHVVRPVSVIDRLGRVKDLGTLAQLVQKMTALPSQGGGPDVLPMPDRARFIGDASQLLTTFSSLRYGEGHGGGAGHPHLARPRAGLPAASVNLSAVLSSLGSELQECLNFVAFKDKASVQHSAGNDQGPTGISRDLALSTIRKYAHACTTGDFHPKRELVDSCLLLLHYQLEIKGQGQGIDISTKELAECTIALFRLPGFWDVCISTPSASGVGQPPGESTPPLAPEVTPDPTPTLTDTTECTLKANTDRGAEGIDSAVQAGEGSHGDGVSETLLYDGLAGHHHNHPNLLMPAAIMKMVVRFMDLSQLAKVTESILPFLVFPNIDVIKTSPLLTRTASLQLINKDVGNGRPSLSVIDTIAMQMADRAGSVMKGSKNKLQGMTAMAILPAVSQWGPLVMESHPAMVGFATHVIALSHKGAQHSNQRLEEEDLARLLALVGSGAILDIPAVMRLISHTKVSGLVNEEGTILPMDQALSRSEAEVWARALRGLEILQKR